MRILRTLVPLSIIAALGLSGCEEKPAEIKVKTVAATNITTSSATLAGSTVDLAGQSLGQHGFVYATSENPTVFSNKLELGPRETQGGSAGARIPIPLSIATAILRMARERGHSPAICLTFPALQPITSGHMPPVKRERVTGSRNHSPLKHAWKRRQ